MSDTHTKGERHGCVVCGRLYELYVVYDSSGKFIDCKVMTPGGHVVPNPARPLVACDNHSADQVDRAVARAYGRQHDAED
jgi:hypothetical protein